MNFPFVLILFLMSTPTFICIFFNGMEHRDNREKRVFSFCKKKKKSAVCNFSGNMYYFWIYKRFGLINVE